MFPFCPLDVVYWTELRFDEGGRYVVCSQKKGEKGYQSWTPMEFNARDRVHEYGGAASFVYDGTLYFTNFKDQNMYKQTGPTEKPQLVTEADKGWRYADGQFSSTVIDIKSWKVSSQMSEALVHL